MGEAEIIARAIYEGRNGRGCTPWARLPDAHKAPYLQDAKVAQRAMFEIQFPGRMQEAPMPRGQGVMD